jgi:hypothetical protein
MGWGDAAVGTAGGELRLEVHQGLLWLVKLSSCGGGLVGRWVEVSEMERKTAKRVEEASGNDEVW